MDNKLFLAEVHHDLKSLVETPYEPAQIHGLFCGLHAAPEMVPHNVWLGAVYNCGTVPQFEDKQKADDILQNLLIAYQQVGKDLNSDSCTPWFSLHDTADEQDYREAALWGKSLLTGLWLGGCRDEQIESKELQDLLLPILYISQNDRLREGVDDEVNQKNKQKSISGFPRIIISIYKYFAQARSISAKDNTADRNALCSCGSGKKVKHCCGQ